MKLYLSITPFFPTNLAFQGPFILDQVKAIQRNSDYKVVVMKPKRWFSKEEDYVYEGIEVYRFSSFELPTNLLPGLLSIISLWSLRRKLKSIGISPNDIEVVHAHVIGLGIFANGLKKLNSKILTILQHHGFDVLSLDNGLFRKFKPHLWFVKRHGIKVCSQIDLHVGVSQKTLDYLQSYNGIKIKQSYVLYNGVDTDKFYPIPGLKNAKRFTIGCVGNFQASKDQITLIKALNILKKKEYKDIYLKFVGTGSTLAYCQKYVFENGLSDVVEFIPAIPNNELVFFYNSLELFVLPSYYEAFGCVYAEAYCCNVPFIAVENQGIVEILDDTIKSLSLIRNQDYEDLANKIIFFIKNHQVQMVRINLDIDVIISKFMKLF